PLAKRIAQREHALFGPRSFFFAARSADGRIELIFVERVKQSRCLQLAAASRDSELQRMGARRNSVFVAMDNDAGADLLRKAIAEFEHLLELVAGVDVKERKWKRPRIKRLAREVHKHAGVLADRVEQHRVPELRNGLAQNVDRLAFELAKMSPLFVHGSITFP